MNVVPVRNGKPCVFRVVHVSGTIRKAEEEVIRRARSLIFEAKGGQAAKATDPLGNIFSTSDRAPRAVPVRGGLSQGDDHDGDVEMGEISDG
jgi:ribonuclease P/MRP protein subunit POP5